MDDVLDLTRSLVDGEVELRNTVPPRITVLGDSGRIVQILNNLLGNAGVCVGGWGMCVWGT